MVFPSSSAASVFPLLGCPVSKKLTRCNHMMLCVQVLSSALRGTQLADHISPDVHAPPAFIEATGKGRNIKPTPNPEYEKWFAKDQTILNYLLSISRERSWAKSSPAPRRPPQLARQ